MDINGAKALKKRLGSNGADEAPPARVAPEACPLTRHPSIAGPARHRLQTAPAEVEDDSAARRASLFSRLSLSFR